MDFDSQCRICTETAGLTEEKPNLVWENDLWVLRHNRKPYAAVGWMTLYSRRHTPGISDFNSAELSEFGPVLQRITRAQLDATDALRIYLGSLNEALPHFHIHLVPRYQHGPKAWDAFGDLERARQGLLRIDEAEVDSVCEDVRRALAKT